MPRSSQINGAERRSGSRRSWLTMQLPQMHPGKCMPQPLDARQVEMVGRLVEQQDVGDGASRRASAVRRASPPDSEEGSSGGRPAQIQRRTRPIRRLGRDGGRIGQRAGRPFHPFVAGFSARGAGAAAGCDRLQPVGRRTAHDPKATLITFRVGDRAGDEADIRICGVALIAAPAEPAMSVRQSPAHSTSSSAFASFRSGCRTPR
jgi:hypothetical protein